MGVSESGAAGSAYHKDIFNSWNTYAIPLYIQLYKLRR